MKIAKKIRKVFIYLLGPEIVCFFVGHAWGEPSRLSWYDDAKCQRCGILRDPNYDPWNE